MSEPCCEKHEPHFQPDFVFNFEPLVVLVLIYQSREPAGILHLLIHGEKIWMIDHKCKSMKMVVLDQTSGLSSLVLCYNVQS